MPDCIFATCEELSDFDPDDRLAVKAFADLGIGVRPVVWSDQRANWDCASACVIRSTWDYHRRPEAFLRWVTTVSQRTRLINPANVVRWNAHKFYLRELERRGIPIVPSEWLRRGKSFDLDATLQRRGWSEAVIKPAHGASAHGVLRVHGSQAQLRAGTEYLTALLQDQDAIVQPYLNSIATYHERALVFFDGTYSHAVTKAPFMHANSRPGDRAQAPPGDSGEVPVVASSQEIAVAARALEAAPRGQVYARVDVVRDDDSCVRVLEVELIEPTLYLFAHPLAPKRFAQAVSRSIVA